MFDWVTSIIATTGYVGIALLMVAENLVPPIPSELIMPLAGFVAAQGQLHPVLVVLAGAGGSVLGSLPWYYAGRWLGRERLCALVGRYGHWATLTDKELGQALDWFERHRGMAVFLGRLVPAVRTLISVPAGVAHMALGPFFLASVAGSLLWSGMLTAAGFVLKAQYALVGTYVDRGSQIILSIILLTYIYRVIAGGRLGKRVRNWARQMSEDVYTVYLAASDARVPWYARVLALCIAAYVVSPVDLIPDVVPVVGHLDDMLLVPLGVWLMLRLIPPALLAEHRQRAALLAVQPRDWRIGALFMAIWSIASAFVLRWLLVYLMEP